MARVIAVERGHCGRMMRDVGDEFDVPDERLKDGSTWFVLKSKAPVLKAPGSGPVPGTGPAKGSRVGTDDAGGLA